MKQILPNQPNKITKSLRLGLVGIAVITLVSACATSPQAASDEKGTVGVEALTPEMQALYEEAIADGGELIYYHQWVPGQEERILDAFKETFPEIDFRASDIGVDGATRFSSESSAGARTADVISQAEYGFADQALEEGWVVDLTAEDIDFPEEYDEQFLKPSEVVTVIEPIRMTINTDLVSDLPTSWEDLAAPEYEGQILIVDPRPVMAWMSFYDMLRDEYGMELLESIGANQTQVFTSAVPATQELAAGGAKALTTNLQVVIDPLADEGAPIEAVPLSPLTGVETTTSMSANAENPAAARLLIAWLHSEPGQIAVSGYGDAGSPLGVEGSVDLGDDYRSPDIESAKEHSDEIVKALRID